MVAINGPAGYRVKRYLGLHPASGTGGREHFPRCAGAGASVAALASAVAAAFGLVFETLLVVELLLASRKNEFLAAILAY